MTVDHTKYAKFKYNNNPSANDNFKLGDVVYKSETDEVGVIIQCHGNDEYRTDTFGNCSYCEKYPTIKKAELITIMRLRPSLFDK